MSLSRNYKLCYLVRDKIEQALEKGLSSATLSHLTIEDEEELKDMTVGDKPITITYVYHPLDCKCTIQSGCACRYIVKEFILSW